MHTYCMSVNGLSKGERLKLKNDIIQLFEAGKSIYTFPISIRYRQVEPHKGSNLLFSVSVPKKKIRLAVNRNRIKRKIREFYRLNKHKLLDNCIKHNHYFHIMVIYATHDLAHIDKAERSLIRLLNDILNEAQ